MSAISTGRRRRHPAPYFLLVPAIIILLLGMGYPVIWQIVTSLQQYGLAQQFGKPAPFVGIDNYLELAGNADLWWVVLRSLLFCVVTAFLTLAVGALLALLMAA